MEGTAAEISVSNREQTMKFEDADDGSGGAGAVEPSASEVLTLKDAEIERLTALVGGKEVRLASTESELCVAKREIGVLRSALADKTRELAQALIDLGSSVGDRSGDVFHYDIAILKDGPLGMDISAHDDVTFLIGGVKEGPILRWNDGRPEGASDAVLRGDRLVAANGVSGDAQSILRMLQSSTSLALSFRRLQKFSVSVLRPAGCVLGCDLKEASGMEEVGGDGVLVQRIGDGLLASVNSLQQVDLQMRDGDKIVEVNGIQDDCRRMLELLQGSTKLQLALLVRRPPAGGAFRCQI